MECEVTFRKRFQIREDQNPADIGRMYIETMGFEVIDTRVLYEEFEQYTLPSYTKKLEEIKKGIIDEL